MKAITTFCLSIYARLENRGEIQRKEKIGPSDHVLHQHFLQIKHLSVLMLPYRD